MAKKGMNESRGWYNLFHVHKYKMAPSLLLFRHCSRNSVLSITCPIRNVLGIYMRRPFLLALSFVLFFVFLFFVSGVSGDLNQKGLAGFAKDQAIVNLGDDFCI